MKQKIIIAIIIASSLAGCGSRNTIDTSGQEKDIIKTFEKDENTKSIVNYAIWNKNIQEKIQENTNEIDNMSIGQLENMGELRIEGNDDSVSYEVIGDTDITYNNIIYKNLYTNINNIDSKYDKNTLINFIIKNYNATSNVIYTTLNKESKLELSDEAEIEEISLDEQLSENIKYKTLKEDYDEPVNWVITLMEADTNKDVMMFGCYSYIILANINGDVIIDMSEFDSTK